MDGTPPAPEGKKRVIKEEVTTHTTTKRTIVEDLEVAGASQLGIYKYIMIIIPGFRKWSALFRGTPRFLVPGNTQKILAEI